MWKDRPCVPWTLPFSDRCVKKTEGSSQYQSAALVSRHNSTAKRFLHQESPPTISTDTRFSPATSDSHSSLSLGMLWWWGPFPQPSSTSSSPGAFFSFFPITQCVTETWTSTPSLDHTHIFTQCLPWACNYESSAVNNTGRSLLWMEFIVLEEVRM